MEYSYSSDEGEQFAHIGDMFGHNDASVQYTGGWPEGWPELQERAVSMGLDEMGLDPHPALAIDNTTEIPTPEQIPQNTRGFFLGRNIGGHTVLGAPQIRAFDPEGAPLEHHGDKRIIYEGYIPGGRSEPPSGQEIQYHHYVMAQSGPASQPAVNTTETVESQFRDEGSSNAFGTEDEGSTLNTSISTHERSSIHDSPWQLVCGKPGCGASYPTQSQLDKHARYHTPKSKRPHVCPVPVCGERFLFVKELVRHALTHAARGYPCDLCNWSFKRGDHLVRHKLKKHERTASAPDMDRSAVLPLSPISPTQHVRPTYSNQRMPSQIPFQPPLDVDAEPEAAEHGMPMVQDNAFHDYEASSPSLNQSYIFSVAPLDQLPTPMSIGYTNTVQTHDAGTFGIPRYLPLSPPTPSRPPRQ